jgi:hypothetical protein|tara:strand:+ start:196 stop:402 length:207 start_codon:yes stop_codon:yes gene_type:complete
MSNEQEFQIMKLVFDKFLWVGTLTMLYGFYKLVTLSINPWYGLSIIIAGAIMMFLFMWILVKEYRFLK